MKFILKTSVATLLLFVSMLATASADTPVLRTDETAPSEIGLDDYLEEEYDYDYDDYSYTEDWEILKFHADITINEDSMVEVTETIIADFTNEAHRGVAREIPYEYTDGGYYKAHFEFVDATNPRGESWNNTVYKEYGYFTVEMRHPELKLMNGRETFVLKYIAAKVIGYFDEETAKMFDTFPHDEFYWNVNGTEWVVPTGIVSATINLPGNFKEDELNLSCITGEFGEIQANCEWKIESPSKVTFTTTKPLQAYENLTIVVGLPPGTLTPISFLKEIYWFLMENKGIFLAPFTFIVMFIIWLSYGRDPQTSRDTVMPHYKPPRELSPTETGTIIDEKLDPRDITATIMDLAIKGYIKITEVKKTIGVDHRLEKIKTYKEGKKFEKLIFKGIFASGDKVKVSNLKNKFYTHLPKIKKEVMTQLIKDDYFPHNPATVRILYRTISGALVFIPFWLGGYFAIGTTIGIIASGAIIFLFGRIMPRKTKKGTETYYELKGLYEYINTAEKDRMKFQEDNNIIFEKLLPYAMAYGIVKKWTKAFDGLIVTPPSWYVPYKAWGAGHPFRMRYMANNLNKMGRRLTSNISSKPSSSGSGGRGSGGSWGGSSGFSSGGGFSGGGFGGGGGRGL